VVDATSHPLVLLSQVDDEEPQITGHLRHGTARPELVADQSYFHFPNELVSKTLPVLV
jgi:hypothetical protein